MAALLLLSLHKGDMEDVAKGLAQLLTDVFPHPDDVARPPHLDNLTLIGYAIEGGMNQKSPLAKQRFDVKRNLDKGGIHLAIAEYHRIKFIGFVICIHLSIFFLVSNVDFVILVYFHDRSQRGIFEETRHDTSAL